MEFPNVPKEIREYQARGAITLRLTVDENGNVKKLEMLNSFPKDIISDYLQENVSKWKFKPLEKTGKKVAVTGILQIPFCYGSFSNWCNY